jgi:tRNA A-37 threonylcarbamoyl transferase component Bud32
MKVIINPKYKHLESFISNIPDQFSKTGNVIYDERNQLRTYSIDGFDIIVKRFKKPFIINRLVYTIFRPSKAKRSYYYAFKLLGKGINTPEPIAFIEQNNHFLLNYSYYFSIYEKNYFHIRDQMEGKNVEINFIHYLSAFIANMHNNGILHKDLSPGNILFCSQESEIIFTIVDINRMKFLHHISKKNRYKSFRRISKNVDIITKLASDYATICSLTVNEAVLEINKYCARFKID